MKLLKVRLIFDNFKQTKSQTNSKWFFQAVVSSKKQRNKFDFTICPLVFDCLLEESQGTKIHFEINWPLTFNDFLYFNLYSVMPSRGPGGGALPPPPFFRSVNPIRTEEGRLSSPNVWFAKKDTNHSCNTLLPLVSFFANQTLLLLAPPMFFTFRPKLYIPSTLNIDLILWHTRLIVCAKPKRPALPIHIKV